MSFLARLFGEKKKTAEIAKNRLSLLIAHERSANSPNADFLPALQRELIEVISKYVPVNPDDIKVQLDKLRLDEPFGVMFPAQLTLNRIELLSIQVAHIEPLTTLPLHHKDPFDRLIAATALVEGLTLVSADPAFDAYGVTRLW